MRILGIDYGTKNLGLAISDESAVIGQGIGTIRRADLQQDLRALRETMDEYSVAEVVIGLPKNMNGSLGPSAQAVLAFVEVLKKTFSVPVETWDERLSTFAAERLLIEADVSRGKRRKVIDKVAAAIILQGYLDYKNQAGRTDP